MFGSLDLNKTTFFPPSSHHTGSICCAVTLSPIDFLPEGVVAGSLHTAHHSLLSNSNTDDAKHHHEAINGHNRHFCLFGRRRVSMGRYVTENPQLPSINHRFHPIFVKRSQRWSITNTHRLQQASATSPSPTSPPTSSPTRQPPTSKPSSATTQPTTSPTSPPGPTRSGTPNGADGRGPCTTSTRKTRPPIHAASTTRATANRRVAW